MPVIDTKKPVWKVFGQLLATNDEVAKGEIARKVISFVNATSEKEAFAAAKLEWPEGTEFSFAHQIDTITGGKIVSNKCSIKCDCICHDTGGSGHDHQGQPCPGKLKRAV